MTCIKYQPNTVFLSFTVDTHCNPVPRKRGFLCNHKSAETNKALNNCTSPYTKTHIKSINRPLLEPELNPKLKLNTELLCLSLSFLYGFFTLLDTHVKACIKYSSITYF